MTSVHMTRSTESVENGETTGCQVGAIAASTGARCFDLEAEATRDIDRLLTELDAGFRRDKRWKHQAALDRELGVCLFRSQGS